MFEYVLLLLVIALFIVYRYYLKPRSEMKRYKVLFQNLGYKVYELPFIFFGLSFAKNYEIGRKLYNDAEYFERTVYPDFDICIGNVLEKVSICLINVDLIKQFLSANLISKYPKYQMMIKGIKTTLGEGVFFSEGQQWKRKRKVMSKVFNFDLIKGNIQKISQICDKCFDKHQSKSINDKNIFKYNTVGLSAGIFNGVMMKCFLGHDQIKDQIRGLPYQQFIVKTISEAGELALTPLLIFFGKIAWNFGITAKIRYVKESIRLMKLKTDQILKKKIEEVMNSPKAQKCTDIIQALIYQKQQKKEEFVYSDNDFIDEFQTFLIAGTDSMANYFTMMIYYLGKHPEIHKKLRTQIDQVIKSDRDITYQNLKKLTYIDWIQFQTTRFFGPANGIFFRIASQNNYIKDLRINKNTILQIQPKGNHYSSKYYKDPCVFRPERWESQCDNLHPYAFLGFSAGPRNCIGRQLAHLESKIALVKLIRRYQKIEVPEQLYFNFTFVYGPQQFQAILTKKSS